MRQKSAVVLYLSLAFSLLLCADVKDASAQQGGGAGARSSVAAAGRPGGTGAPTDSDKSAEASSRTASPAASEGDRIRALEEALLEQNTRLAQMQSVIEDQQRMIRLLDGRTAVGTDAASPPEASKSGLLPAADSTLATGTSPDTTSERPSQQPTIEDRLKRVEERVTRIGPVRLSGDFRLRLDGILREATTPPDPGLQHVQNVRMRYRLRLNLDSDLNRAIGFHGQLTTGPINNPLTQDQDFTSTVVRHPLFINEAWIDFHPNKHVQLQGGRLQEVFADNSRFLFDDDVRFNGFNERFIFPFGEKGGASVELRAGQYWFSNPNVAVIAPGSPLAIAGDEIGTIGRSSNLFHQGMLVNVQTGENWTHQFGGDVQVFREPNQIQLASIANGVVFIVQPGLGLVLSGPIAGTGNATATPGGAIYAAEDFHIARVTYRLNHTGFRIGEHAYPVMFTAQVARNFGTDGKERDALLTAIQMGRPSKFGDMSFLYVFSIKGANSLISQLTDDDLGTGSGVNLRTHYFRWEFGVARNVTLQSLFFVQRELRNSGQFPDFFVPLNAFTPSQYRFQEQLVFTF